MRYLTFLIVFIFCTAGALSAPAQDDGEKSPRLKTFGRSLKQRKKEKDRRKAPPEKSAPNADPVDEDEIKVDIDLVVTDVLVFDRNKRLVEGLGKEDFVIMENEQPQEIEIFSSGTNAAVARSVVLIIDYSGSQRPFIENSVRAAKVLIDKLNPRDRVAVVTDDIKLLVDFTRDREEIKQILDRLVRRSKSSRFGDSRQYSALMATLSEMFDEEDLRPIIIFQTDGDESGAIPHTAEEDARKRPADRFGYTVAELFAAIERSKATIYSVIPGISMLDATPAERIERLQLIPESVRYPFLSPEKMAERIFHNQNSMVETARVSGGFASALETPEQADAIYSRILSGIENRYLLGYYPADQTRDGRRRTIKITVRGHPEYLVQGRNYYYAPEP